MFDQRARPIVARVTAPVAERVVTPPLVLTLSGLVFGLAAAGAASLGWWTAAIVLWLVNRSFDGLDGATARARSSASDLGGYLDFVADMFVYVTIPLGIAIGTGRTSMWVVVAFLLASFTLNVVTLAHLATLLEKRGRGITATGEITSVTMPFGLVEGAETIVFFSLALLWPGDAEWILGAMAAGVLVGAAARVARGVQLLRVNS